MQKLVFLFLSLSVCLIAEESKESFECRRALKELNESKLLFAFGNEKEKLDAWSSDLIARIVIELRGPYLEYCPSGRALKAKADLLEEVYLKKLGSTKVEENERELLFRTLLTLKEDFEKLKAKIIEKKISLTSYKKLGALYKGIDEFNGIALVSEGEVNWEPFKAFLTAICQKAKTPCPFVASGTLFKVLITQTPGVAAFIPEIAILVLSEELIQDLNPLHKLVILHELSHVAIKQAWNATREDWAEEFKSFSGWKKTKDTWSASVKSEMRVKEDELLELSKNSNYSLLPDPHTYGVKGKKKLDGFVFHKSYSESLDRKDISEDLSDSIAAYFVAPHRFCHKGKEWAPLKKAWIEKKIFPGSKISCSP